VKYVELRIFSGLFLTKKAPKHYIVLELSQFSL